MIGDTITKEIANALKARDEVRLSTLRLLSSALNYEFIAKQRKLSEEEELVIVRREAKKRKEAIESYKNAKAFDRAEKEEKELKILQEFLPEELPDDEISKIVSKVIADTGMKNVNEMGKVMGFVMKNIGGRADGGRVTQIVKIKMQNLK